MATIGAGAGIGVGTAFVANGWVKSGGLFPVLSDFAVERDNITALRPESRRQSRRSRIPEDADRSVLIDLR